MPFTPSHAIVALPFVRTPLVPAAIAVAAMAPDLPLFVRGFGLDYSQTHDLAWLPATMLIALALLLTWRCMLRPGVRELSPAWLASRLPLQWDRSAAGALRDTLAISAVREPGRRQRWRASWPAAAFLVVSLAIGVVSHIVWDLFTHEERAGVTAIPALGDMWGPLLGYKWLQYGSSALGMVILVVYAAVWLAKRDAAGGPAPQRLRAPAQSADGGAEWPVDRIVPQWVRWSWWLSLPVMLVIAWLLGLAAYGPLDVDFTVAHLAYRVLPPACALWGILTLALCLTVQWFRAVRRPSAR